MLRPDEIKPVFSCKNCSLNRFARRPVWGRGPKKPLFILIGEGPGIEDDETGRPFHPEAPVGELITEVLKDVGVKRSDIYITFATKCFRGWSSNGGGEIETEHIKACKPYLLQELESLDCKYVVLAGNEAMKAMLGHVGITKEHGRLQLGPDGRKYFPILHPASALPNRWPENRDKIKTALRDLVAKIRREQNDPLKEIKCTIVNSPELLDKFERKLKSLPKDTLVVSDYETNSVLSPFHINNFIISGASFVWDTSGGYYLPLDHQNPANIWTQEEYIRVRELFRWYARSPYRKGNQNIKYEYNITRGAFGVRMRRVYTDPMLMSHLLRPDPGTHGLDKLAWEVGMGGYDMALEEWFSENKISDDKRDYTKVPLDVLAPYAVADGVCALKYHLKNWKVVCKRKQAKFYVKHVMGGVSAYANIEARGILIDLVYLKKLDKHYTDLSRKTRNMLRRIASDAGRKMGSDFNFDSPAQLSNFLQKWLRLDKLLRRQIKIKQSGQKRWRGDEPSKDPVDHVEFAKKSGLVSTSRSTLTGLLAYYPMSDEQRQFIGILLKYRGWRKRYSTNVKGMLKYMCPDGRIRSSILIHGTATARRSTTRPNQQNFPRDSLVRRVYVAAKWHVFVMFDYKNLEVRIAAALSADKQLLYAFNSGKDVHSYVASRAYGLDYDKMVGVLGSPWEEVKKIPSLEKQYIKYTTYRNRAKIISWVILFGGGADKIATTAGIPFSQAEALLNRVFDEFNGLRDMQERFSDFADTNGYARTDFGRRRYLLGINSKDVRTYNEAIRQSLNTPIQGTAADITYQAIRRLDRMWLRKKLQAYNVQEVHDSVSIETHYSNLYSVIVLGKRIMESITTPSAEGKIKFEVDATIGAHLGSKTKITKEVLALAKDDPRELYDRCRKELDYEPEYYVVPEAA